MVYNLTCTVSKTVDGLVNSPTVNWTIGDVIVSSGNYVAVTPTTDDVSATTTLTFDPVRTSHGNRFVCEGSLTSPALVTPLTLSALEADLHVQSKLYS